MQVQKEQLDLYCDGEGDEDLGVVMVAAVVVVG
jgi:hypothetical protein